ncbi:MAG: class I SAM-dependent methyltransferase [Acidobacteriota bacterium]|nr:class I SAM-dependent methyltransferase [Acidobacteriota bacterium]
MKGVEQIPWLYDLYMSLVDHLGFARWRWWVVGGAEGRTLEVGCGTGRNLPFYEPEVTVVGLELDLLLLRAARKKVNHALLVVGSAEALPFRDTAFDTIVSSLVFCSVRDPELGLREVARVLRPSGKLRMLEHVRSEVRVMAMLQNLAQPAWTLVTGGCHPNRGTEATLRRVGFEIDADSRRANGTMRRFAARYSSMDPGK